MAWLLDEDGHAAKLDLTQNIIVRGAPIGSPTHVDDAAIDPVRGLLFVPNGRGLSIVDVYDLKSLKGKGQLDFPVEVAPTDDAETIRFVFPLSGPIFFARVWNKEAAGGAGAFEVAIIDAATFRTSARRNVSPPLAAQLMISPGATQVYSMRSEKPARVDVFDLPGFSLRASLDLEQFINPQAYGRGISDFGGGKALIIENEKLRREDPSAYTLFVVNVGAGTVGPKIRTGSRGRGTLLFKRDRVVFAEQKMVFDPLSQVPRGADTGIIQVFDAVTGNRLGIVNIPGVQEGGVLGVSPNEDVLYYQSFEGLASNPRLWVVNLQTFSVTAQLPLPFRAWRMFLFDE